MTDYYAVLGVSRQATPSVLRIAYEGKLKGLAKSNLSEAERQAEAKQIESAFATLSDPLRRERHDERLEAAVRKEENRARAVPWKRFVMIDCRSMHMAIARRTRLSENNGLRLFQAMKL